MTIQPLVGDAEQTDDAQRPVLAQLNAGVPTVSMTGQHQVGTARRQGDKGARVVVEQNARNRLPRTPGVDEATVARVSLKTLKEKVQAGEFQGLSVNRERRHPIAQGGDAGLAQIADEAVEERRSHGCPNTPTGRTVP